MTESACNKDMLRWQQEIDEENRRWEEAQKTTPYRDYTYRREEHEENIARLQRELRLATPTQTRDEKQVEREKFQEAWHQQMTWVNELKDQNMEEQIKTLKKMAKNRRDLEALFNRIQNT